jgi:hypothetical protein
MAAPDDEGAADEPQREADERSGHVEDQVIDVRDPPGKPDQQRQAELRGFDRERDDEAQGRDPDPRSPAD